MSDIASFAEKNNINIALCEPMRTHISFRLGGCADRFIWAPSALAPKLISMLAGEKYAVIGNGTNLLVRDGGFRGTVIKLLPQAPVFSGNRVSASAGTSLALLASAAAERALSGLEFAHGIPGSLGGAVFMNAGAYGGEISSMLVSSTYCDGSGGVFTLPADKHDFGYRQSFYKNNPDCTLISAEFALQDGKKEDIFARMEEFSSKRRAAQPLEYPSAGSFFKRPRNNFAGKLIEDAGLKGFAVGGACVSEKHAGFIINRGGATCADVLALSEHIEKTVLERFGVRLEREVKILGEE